LDCSEDLVCQLFDWFSSSPYVVQQIAQTLDSIWGAAGGFLTQHGEKIVAAASFSFAVWRWWIYREQVLHKRLEEYIRESDERLGPSTTRMMEAILRPGRGVAVAQPAYALELNQVLEAGGWRRLFGLGPVEAQTQRQLKRALVGVRNRQRTVANASRSLQRQRAEIYMLKGALAASQARRMPKQDNAGARDGRALREFQRALQSDTHRRDAEAKECEAFQLLRLGQRALAYAAYEDLEDFAKGINDPRKRDLTIARARRYRAQLMQTGANNGSMAALNLIGANRQPDDQSSLRLRARHGPFLVWDAVEQAECHYVAAYIACRLSANLIEGEQLKLSKDLYDEVLEKLPTRLIFVRWSTRALRDEAQAGRARVVLAEEGKYDTAWLM
jgi:hypothetical protein